MAGLSDYAEQQILNWINGKSDPDTVTTRYIALFTAAPSDSGGGTEVSGGSYARQAITSAMETESGTDGETTNTSAITFPEATADWGEVTHIATFDALSGGNLIMHGELDLGITINSGGRFEFDASALNVNLG